MAASRAARSTRPFSPIADFGQRHALVLGVSANDLAIFRMHAARDQSAGASGEAHGHHHGFGRAGRAVVHRGVRDFHAGQFADHRLEFEDGLQRALRDLRLVGRVGGEELAARDQRVDDDRTVVVVGARAEEDGVAGARSRSERALNQSTISDSAIWRGMSRSRLRRYSAGMDAKRSSMELTPISRSIWSRSAGDFGR